MRLFPSAVIVLLVDGDAVPETSNRFGDLGRQWIVLVSRRNSLQCRKMSDVSRTSCRACNVRLQPAFPIRTGDRISHARCRHDDAEARRDEKSSRWTYAPRDLSPTMIARFCACRSYANASAAENVLAAERM